MNPNRLTSQSISPDDYLLFIYQQQIIVDARGSWSLMKRNDLSPLFKQYLRENTPVNVGEYASRQCYVIEVAQSVDDVQLIHLRALMKTVNHDQRYLISRALQLITWQKQHQYCGQCGQKNTPHAQEQALHCEPCELFYYPRISPCMMCLIVKDDYCLLARHQKHPSGFYSTLAGFVEAGESVEQTVHREVMEEVGLTVGKLTYFSTQPWPFPHQLMIAYFAEYASGDIRIDHNEILDAQWFHYTELPEVPSIETISGMLINAFVQQCQQKLNGI
jgi:NAD+ diphosphatase